MKHKNEEVEAGMRVIQKANECPCCGYGGFWQLEKKKDGSYGFGHYHNMMHRKLVNRILTAVEKLR